MTLEEKLKSYGFRKASRVSAKRHSTIDPRVKTVPVGGYGLPSKRIGVALTKPRGTDKRRDEYGIFRSAYGTLSAEYEGYRLPDGTSVGTALGGRGWKPPVRIEFKKSDYDLIRFFDKTP